ncbi:MAG TPA: carboxypeptidase-like regulatory domain-containing protein [Kofleriaceae bacterium]
MRTLLAATIVIAIVIALAASAIADSEVTGFVTSGSGELSGRVTDLDNKPLKGVKVHIAPKHAAEQIVTTDGDGNYRLAHFAGDYAYVYVEAKVKIAGQVVVAAKEGDVETVEMRETLPPAVQPKPLTPTWIVPDYSELAEDKNTWTRAWLLLEVSANGDVTRVNLLDKPGLDLDKIAVRDAFKLKFEPARDRTNHKVPAMVVWTYEWPPYFWMVNYQSVPHQLPNAVGLVPCHPDGRSSVIRDCSKPTMANAMTQPWFTKP